MSENIQISSQSGNGPKYFLNLYTQKTWDVVERHGQSVTGFPKTRHGWAKKVQPGDYLLCYMTGAKKFIGIQKVESECFVDDTDFGWGKDAFPIRFKVSPVMNLKPENGVRAEELLPKLHAYERLKAKNRWSILVRGSLLEYGKSDAKVIENALHERLASKATSRTESAKDPKVDVEQRIEEQSPTLVEKNFAQTTDLQDDITEKLRRLRDLRTQELVTADAARRFEDKILTRYLGL